MFIIKKLIVFIEKLILIYDAINKCILTYVFLLISYSDSC